jgi:hypothetical protein
MPNLSPLIIVTFVLSFMIILFFVIVIARQYRITNSHTPNQLNRTIDKEEKEQSRKVHPGKEAIYQLPIQQENIDSERTFRYSILDLYFNEIPNDIENFSECIFDPEFPNDAALNELFTGPISLARQSTNVNSSISI